MVMVGRGHSPRYALCVPSLERGSEKNLDIFLSRLCGGELGAFGFCAVVKFLSRLCGGESADADRDRTSAFLSRLCGGEHNRSTHGRILCFLSHLCGGEPTASLA